MQENQNRPSKRTYTVHRVRRSVRGLLGPAKRDTTLQREKDSGYFGHIWTDRETYETLKFVARVNRMTLKETANQVIRAGLSHILGAAIAESNRQQATLREQGLAPRPTPFMREFEHWAKTKGRDVAKFFEEKSRTQK